VLYVHPQRLREIYRDISRDELAAAGIWPGRPSRAFGVELLETHKIPEVPGWLILPRPPIDPADRRRASPVDWAGAGMRDRRKRP
jgi:hypothetical protein